MNRKVRNTALSLSYLYKDCCMTKEERDVNVFFIILFLHQVCFSKKIQDILNVISNFYRHVCNLSMENMGVMTTLLHILQLST